MRAALMVRQVFPYTTVLSCPRCPGRCPGVQWTWLQPKSGRPRPPQTCLQPFGASARPPQRPHRCMAPSLCRGWGGRAGPQHRTYVVRHARPLLWIAACRCSVMSRASPPLPAGVLPGLGRRRSTGPSCVTPRATMWRTTTKSWSPAGEASCASGARCSADGQTLSASCRLWLPKGPAACHPWIAEVPRKPWQPGGGGFGLSPLSGSWRERCCATPAQTSSRPSWRTRRASWTCPSARSEWLQPGLSRPRATPMGFV